MADDNERRVETDEDVFLPNFIRGVLTIEYE
jgi:hypothetical protein